MRYIPFFLFLLCIGSCKTPQQLELSEGEIMSDLHQENFGRITFMNETIPFETYTEEDFKQEVLLNESTDFSFRMFLEKTLTYYLHQLAPEMEVNDLCKKGNFEVSFHVDGELAYKERLIPGAGSCWYKNSATVYRIPLVSLDEVDHWGRFMFGRFMYREGGQDLLSDGKHKLKIEVRPYLELDQVLTGDVIANGEVIVNVTEEEVEVEESLMQIQEIAPGSGWDLSNHSYDKELIKKLNKDIAANKFKDISSIVVLKEGKLLLEEYFTGSDRAEKYNTRSVGKSFMSAVMGIAIDQGHIKSEDEKLSNYYDLTKFDNFSDAKQNVTLKDLLTMSSGFNGDDGNMDSPGNEEYMYPTKDWVKFGLDLSMREDRKWTYFTAGSVILGDIIHQSVPGGLEKFAEKNMFEPLGIQDYKWQYTPKRIANTAGGIQMNALDFAKFGQLYKNKGTWKGKQIISEEWIRKSFERHAVIDEEAGDYYGYQFWEKTFTIEGRDYNVNYCTGTGGNKIYIFNELPLVIVITAKAFRLPQAHSQVDQMMKKYILPAVIQH